MSFHNFELVFEVCSQTLNCLMSDRRGYRFPECFSHSVGVLEFGTMTDMSGQRNKTYPSYSTYKKLSSEILAMISIRRKLPC